MSIAEALGLMIAFGSLIATVIFGILDAVKKTKK
ncbi:putative holin-like toxin [Tetragenococcus koreensis]